MAGLKDSFRSEKPTTYTSQDRNKILAILEERPPCGQRSWDGKTIATQLDFSEDHVWRVLRTEGIQLQRRRSWCVRTDKEFAANSEDINGLYLHPPEPSIVLCVDEKPGVQALSRKRGYVQNSNKKIVQGLQSTYTRNGKINLFAVFNVATGQIEKKMTASKKREDFQAFMDDGVRDMPSDQEVHVILDNYCTHNKTDAWLHKHRNMHFHFTPTSASWLNMLEIWCGIF